jgi:uncharacterized membrane protein YdjX (TVP38/TMEM64 family)
VLGSIIFVFVQGLSACLLLPVTPFGFLAGAIFPFPVAVFLVLTGNQIGIILAIAVGRTFLRPWIQSKLMIYPKMKAIDRAMAQDGFKLAVLLRLTPVFPFGVCNWIFSTSQIKAFHICFGSLLGNIPNTIIHVSVGSIVGPGPQGHSEMPPKLKKISILLTIFFAFGSSVFITLMAKRALRSVVNLDIIEEGVVLSEGGSSASDSMTESLFQPNEQDLRIYNQAEFTEAEKQLLTATFVIIILGLSIGIPLILM